MILPTPRIVAIDDELPHLQGISDGIQRHGSDCLAVHFNGNIKWVRPCPHVRIVIADLHLTPGAASDDQTRHFGVIQSILEQTLVPRGPYLLVLWTHFAQEAASLRAFLQERLTGASRPLDVIALDKAHHLEPTGAVRDMPALVAAIDASLKTLPAFAALLNWEARVIAAAGDTLSELVGLGAPAAGGTGLPPLDRLLPSLAIAAVGAERVDTRRFAAVNDALMPVLVDRVSSSPTTEDEDVWKNAFAPVTAGNLPKLSADEAAKLNRAIHIAPTCLPTDRGAVLPLPPSLAAAFEKTFGLGSTLAATEEFGQREGDTSGRWVLVQMQAPCDFAQAQSGPLPFVLGLELAAAKIPGNAPKALLSTPPFASPTGLRVLRMNVRFALSLAASEVASATVLYRLRDQLLNDLSFRAHTYSARPGSLTF